MMDDPTPDEQEGEEQQPTADGEAEAPAKDDPLAAVRHEAAGYRVKLREAEAERDRLAETVETMQRAEVERLATASFHSLADGEDLWRAGAELSSLLGEDGQVDAEKVEAATAQALEHHPHWRASSPSFDGGVRGTTRTTPDFAESLRRAAGG